MTQKQKNILLIGGVIGGGFLLSSSFTLSDDMKNTNFSFDKLVIRVLKWEARWKAANNEFDFEFINGGYSNHPNDKGGETSWGITKKYYPHLDIKNITFEQAKAIYLSDYWKRYKCVLLPTHLRYIFFDCVVNQGGNFATKLLQQLANVTQDGIVGPITVNGSKKVTAKAFADGRKQRYIEIIKADPTQEVFRQGWFNRINDVLAVQEQLSKPVV
jgi:lysozyme family protein